MAEDIREKLNTIIAGNKDKKWTEIVEMLDEELTKENMPEAEKENLKNELLKGFKGKKGNFEPAPSIEENNDVKFLWLKEKLTKKGYVVTLTKNLGYTKDQIDNMVYELDSTWMQDMRLSPDEALQNKLLKGANKNKWNKLINDLKEIEEEVLTYQSIKATNDSHDRKVEAEQIALETARQKAIQQEKAEKKRKLVMITAVATAAAIATAGIAAIVYNLKKDDIKRNKLETEIEQQLEERFEAVYEDGAKPFIGVSSAEGKYPNNVDWEEFEKDVNAFIEINKPLLQTQDNDLTSAERIKKEIVLSSIAYGNKKYGNGGREFSEKVAKTLGVYEDLDYNAYEDYVDDIADEREGKGARQ